MIKLSKGQKVVLWAASTPMAAAGIAGATATYFNMDRILNSGATAAGLVAAGEGATLICALVALLVTLMGQHTPTIVRLGMWLVPLAASATGAVVAPDLNMKVAMAVTPLAMTASGEGIAFVARRIVMHNTGVDLEAQRRAGLLVWHAGRAQNGGWLGKRLSKAAVWRLTKSFASTDNQMHIQVDDIQRFRIGENLDVNLTDVLAGKAPVKAAQRPAAVPAAPAAPQLPAAPVQAATEPSTDDDEQDDEHQPRYADDPDGSSFIAGIMAQAEANVAADTTVKLLTVADVATLKEVSPGTVRSWVNRKKLTVAQRDDNGRSLFHPLDVAKLD
jgi:hypothetical protein